MKVVTRLIDLIAALCIQEYWQFLSRRRGPAAAKSPQSTQWTDGQTPVTETQRRQ